MRKDEIAATAKLVRHGVYQYVRLPKEFQFEGDLVQIRRYQSGVLLLPLIKDSSSKRSTKAKS